MMINLFLQMMESEALKNLFLKLVNMSISASWIVLVVLILRLILKKAPKWVSVLLWGIVAVRLICPFSFESVLSLIPSAETIPMNIEMDATPSIDSGINAVNSVVNPIISASFTPHPGGSVNPLQVWIPMAALIWFFGMVLMVLYTATSYWHLRRKVDTAVRFEDNIYQSENIGSPFVLGILKPRIYLPYSMDGKNLDHVVAHEQAHISRKDHWWKPLGFLLLTVYWFNPLMWVAYILLCRDIELACDEKVIANLENEQRADYTQALVACSINRRMIAACPLAFGEVGVKDRVKSIMNYRKPAFWIIIAALVLCVVVAVCFLTNPVEGSTILMSGEYYISDMLYSHTPINEENFVPSDRYTISSEFQLQEKNADGQWTNLGAMEAYPLTNKELYSYNLEGWHRHYPLRKITDAYILRVENDFFYFAFQTKGGKTYLAYGWEDMGERGQPGSDDTGLRRLYQLEPASNSSVTRWFDYTEAPSEMSYEDELKIQLEEFPGITFKYTPYDITATTSWKDSNTADKKVLISGMPIWNAYFCDLTGDGKPEICSQVSYGSGIIDNRIIILDYSNGISYKMEDRGIFDYYLCMQNGQLYVHKWDHNQNLPVSSGRLEFQNGSMQIEGENSQPINILQAELLEIHDDFYVVEPLPGSAESSSASRIEVPMKNMEPSPEPQVGDILEIEYDGHLQETYPARISNPYSVKVIEEAVSWDRIPMVMVDGVLYLDTGMESTVMARCGMMDGEITSEVPGNEEPSMDDQSNFGTGYGYQYGAIEGTIEIFMNEKWWIFATEEARKEIQFPVESTESETPERQKVEEYLIDYTINQVKSRLTKTDINILSITDHYALVQIFGESPELIVYHYTFDNITRGVNITGIVRGDLESSTEFSINHFRMDDQHVYFGTIRMKNGNPIERIMNSADNLSMKFISEDGETFETTFQNDSYFLITLNAPLADFKILDVKNKMHLNLDAYLDQGHAIQEKSMLIAALGTNGIRGFVKAEDLAGYQPSNPEEAIAYMEEMEKKTAYGTKKYVRLIPLYTEDGVTVIGEFAIG